MSFLGNELLSRVVPLVEGMDTDMAKSILHSLYPKEFEVYMVSLELTDFSGKTLDLFTFPINPTSIYKSEPYTKSINRGHGGVVVNRSGFFTPQEITLRGNFGKDYKTLIRGEVLSFNSLRLNFVTSSSDELSHTIKSGYGSFKVLQEICSKSNELDGNNRPNLLFFHNFVFGESYLVEVLDFSSDMSVQTNMLYGYSLRLKIVSPISIKEKRLSTLMNGGVVQKTLQKVGEVVQNTSILELTTTLCII